MADDGFGDDTERRATLDLIAEVAESLWDAARRAQDVLDEMENEQVGRWAAYSAFREVGAVFQSAIRRLHAQDASDDQVSEILQAYQAGAQAALEGAADLAEAMQDQTIESIDRGIDRLALAGHNFVRGRYLVQRLAGGDQSLDGPESDGGSKGGGEDAVDG